MVLGDIGIFSFQYGDLALAAIIVVISLVVAKVFYTVMKKIVLKAAARTKTTLDDEIVLAIKKPIYLAILVGGVYFASTFIAFLDPYAGLLEKLFLIIGVFVGISFLSSIVSAIISWYGKEIASKSKTKMDDTLLPLVRKIVVVIIYAIGLMIILRGFGIEITPLLAGLGIGGLAIALALQSTLSNLFSGAYVATDESVNAGDYIELDNGIKGFIEEIGWRSTKVKTLPNNIVIIPNSRLADSIITNYSAPQQNMSVVVPVGVGYGSDLDKVEEITIDVAKHVLKKTTGADKEFDPFIRYNEFGDSNINFSVILRVNAFVDKYLVTHEFIKALKKRYDEEGIEIAWPVRTINYMDEKAKKKAGPKKKSISSRKKKRSKK